MKARNILIICLLTAWKFSTAQKITFFDHEHYEDRLYESKVGQYCDNLPSRAVGKASSVKTEACVELYAGAQCTGKFYVVDPAQGNKGAEFIQYFNDRTTSFRPCNLNLTEDEGNTLQIKLYEHKDFEQLIGEFPIKSTCTNLPNSQANKVTSAIAPICILLFSHENCDGARFRLDDNLGQYSEIKEFNDQTDSFMPCNPEDLNRPKKNIKLTGRISEVEFYLDEDSDEDHSESVEIAMGPEESHFNNGSVIIIRDYSTTKTIPETVVLTRSKDSIELFSEFKISSLFQSRFASEIPSSIKSKIVSAFKSAFKNNEIEEVYKNVEMNEISFNEKIQILPCTWYQVSPVLNLVENFQVFYTAKVEVSKKGMSQTNLNDMLEKAGLEVILGETNSTESETELKGTINLDFVTRQMIVGNGGRIENCQSTSP